MAVCAWTLNRMPADENLGLTRFLPSWTWWEEEINLTAATTLSCTHWLREMSIRIGKQLPHSVKQPFAVLASSLAYIGKGGKWQTSQNNGTTKHRFERNERLKHWSAGNDPLDDAYEVKGCNKWTWINCFIQQQAQFSLPVIKWWMAKKGDKCSFR